MLDKIEILERVVVHYSVQNGGDGSAYPAWFLTGEDAEFDQSNMSEGWGEDCSGSVETFIGSDIHRAALAGSKTLGINRSIEGMNQEEVIAYFDSNNIPYHLNQKDGKYSPYEGEGSIYRISFYSGGSADISFW
jgi:hypothetical protein